MLVSGPQICCKGDGVRESSVSSFVGRIPGWNRIVGWGSRTWIPPSLMPTMLWDSQGSRVSRSFDWCMPKYFCLFMQTSCSDWQVFEDYLRIGNIGVSQSFCTGPDDRSATDAPSWRVQSFTRFVQNVTKRFSLKIMKPLHGKYQIKYCSTIKSHDSKRTAQPP